MKRHNVILDFTSLLDVTLIVIFFFVLFSHLENQENKDKTDQKILQMNEAISAADKTKENYEELSAQLENEINIVRQTSEKKAASICGILEYTKSGNLKIILDIQETDWNLRVLKGNVLIKNIQKSNEKDMQKFLEEAFNIAGYKNENVIFCEFIYNGSIPGSRLAYRIVINALNVVGSKYENLYISKTNLAI